MIERTQGVPASRAGVERHFRTLAQSRVDPLSHV